MGETLHKKGIEKYRTRDIGKELLYHSEELIFGNSNFTSKLAPRTYFPF